MRYDFVESERMYSKDIYIPKLAPAIALQESDVRR